MSEEDCLLTLCSVVLYVGGNLRLLNDWMSERVNLHRTGIRLIRGSSWHPSSSPMGRKILPWFLKVTLMSFDLRARRPSVLCAAVPLGEGVRRRGELELNIPGQAHQPPEE